MLSGAYAQKQFSAEDPVFSAPFYAPYETALAAGLSILEAARAAMPLDVLALSSRLKSGASIRGKLLNIRCQYLQSWSADPNSPLSWRFVKETAGAGTERGNT